MDADILKKLGNKKPFREIEIPKELLENILLIPAELGPCHVPIIKIERNLSHEQVKVLMAYEDGKYRGFHKALGMDIEKPPKNLTFKQLLIRKDFDLLAEIVATNYYSKIRGQNPDWSNLHQMVEIDWSVLDFYPDGQAIHYEIFTKREIFIRQSAEGVTNG